MCCRLGHSTVSPGETLSPMLDPRKCLLTPKLFESVAGEKPSNFSKIKRPKYALILLLTNVIILITTLWSSRG